MTSRMDRRESESISPGTVKGAFSEALKDAQADARAAGANTLSEKLRQEFRENTVSETEIAIANRRQNRRRLSSSRNTSPSLKTFSTQSMHFALTFSP